MAVLRELAVNLKGPLFSREWSLGEELDRLIEDLVSPIIEENVVGRFYFPDHSVLTCYPTTTLMTERWAGEWRLVVNDPEYEDTALLAYHPAYGKTSLVECPKEEAFLDFLNQARKNQEPVLVLDRLASSTEIESLQARCEDCLNGESSVDLFAIEGSIFRTSHQPVFHRLTIDQLNRRSCYILNLRTDLNSLGGEKTESHEMAVSLNQKSPLAIFDPKGQKVEPLSQVYIVIFSRVIDSGQVVRE